MRLNPQLSEDPPRLDEVDRIHYIQEVARKQLISDHNIERVALQLIASSFYFEMSTSLDVSQDGTAHCKGMETNSVAGLTC